MGGSSLCPEVLSETFGQLPGGPRAPCARLDRSRAGRRGRSARRSRPHARSSSPASRGATLEPNIFHAYFFQRMAAAVGAGAGRAALRRDHRSRDRSSRPSPSATASGASSPACRASAAATPRCRPSAWCRRRRWGSTSPLAREPARWSTPAVPVGPPRPIPVSRSGCCSARCAARGRDKLTLIVSPRHLRPRRLARAAHRRVDGQERPGRSSRSTARRSAPPARYGPIASSSTCVSPRRQTTRRMPPSRRSSRRAARRAHRRRRAVRRSAGEFFRWEIATAVAGAVMGINPFDQPDVEASKIETRKLTDRLRGDGPPARRDAASSTATACALFTDAPNARSARGGGRRRPTLGGVAARAPRAARRRRLLRAARLRRR